MGKKRKNKNTVSNNISPENVEALKALKNELKIEEEANDEYNKFYVPVNNSEIKTCSNQEILKRISDNKFELLDEINVSNVMSDLIQLQLNRINEIIASYYTQLSYTDMITNDIKHLIENTNFSAAQGYDLAKALQIVLRKRRVIKEDINLLCELRKKLLLEDSNLMELNKFASNLQEKNISNRCNMITYKFRILKDADPKLRYIRSMVDELLNKNNEESVNYENANDESFE